MEGLRVFGKVKRSPGMGPVLKSRRLVNNAVKKLRGRTPEVGRFSKGAPSKNTHQRESDNSSLDRNGPKLVSTTQHSNLEDQCDDDEGIYTINLPDCDIIPVTSSGSMEMESEGKSLSLSRRKYSDLLRFQSDEEEDDKSTGTMVKSRTSYPSEAFGGSNGNWKPVTRRNYSDLLKKSKFKGEEPDLVYLD